MLIATLRRWGCVTALETSSTIAFEAPFLDLEAERVASACMRRHQDFALPPVRERDDYACICRHQAFTLDSVRVLSNMSLCDAARANFLALPEEPE